MKTSKDMFRDTPLREPEVKLGLPNEQMGKSGAYHCWMPGFMIVSISPDFSFVQYRFEYNNYASNKMHTVPCNGLLQAYGIILQLIKEHEQTQFLPAALADMDTDPHPDDDSTQE